MTLADQTTSDPGAAAPYRPHRRTLAAAAALAFFAVGAGATALAQRSSQASFVALSPAPIAAMTDGSRVAVKGEVAEIFGNKFILQDDGGRTLVETGPRGDSGKLVAKSETVTVQGRFDHGFVHAVEIQHADGRSEVVGPPAPPPPKPPGPMVDATKG